MIIKDTLELKCFIYLYSTHIKYKANRYVDKSLMIISQYAKKWRYSYNAKKSAILVFGESKREHEKGVKYRNFLLNGNKVPERVEKKRSCWHKELPI